MTRMMKITVLNKTAWVLVLTSKNLKHGKWTDGEEPTLVIKSGEKGFINSQKRTLGAFGTEGYCTYVVMESGAHPTFEVSWSKPYSGKSFVKADMQTSDTFSFHPAVETIHDTAEHFEALVTVTENK